MRLVPFVLRLIAVGTIVLVAGLWCFGQSSADNRSPMFNAPKERRPKPIEETFERMRIENEKKEFEQMMERGEQALRISSQVARAFEVNGKLTDREISQLASVEKLAKQIRNKLGGDDDGSANVKGRTLDPGTPADLVASLRRSTAELMDELKKTTRFTISAPAIETTNAVLRFTRLLRLKR